MENGTVEITIIIIKKKKKTFYQLNKETNTKKVTRTS